jgi:urea carboxylase system permease
MIIGALMAAPSLTDGELATQGLPYVLNSVLSSPWGTVLLIDVAIAILICTLAIQTAASRLMFSMARDGRLPASRVLGSVNKTTGTPIAPAVVIGLGCVLVLVVNVGNSAIFSTLASVCIVLIYLAYMMVTVPLLLQRLKGWPHNTTGAPKVDSEGKPLFTLGRLGLPVNLLAVVYGAAMVVNLSWPRPEIYDPSGDFPLLRWAAPLTVLAVVAVGALCFPRGKAHPNPVTTGVSA